RFGRERRRGALDRNDYGHLAANQIGRQRRQSVQLTFRPAVLHCDVAALEIAGFVEASPDRVERAGFTIGAAEQPDHRHRPLLRSRGERPRRRAAEQRDELAAFHSITSSALNRTAVGNSRPSDLAVLRFTTSSTLVGCWTGKSAGLAPLRIWPV